MYSKLRKIRNNNQYTVQQMADMLGISKSFYSQLETRNRRLFYDMAVKIATIFNMRPDEIFYDDHINNKRKNKLKVLFSFFTLYYDKLILEVI